MTSLPDLQPDMLVREIVMLQHRVDVDLTRRALARGFDSIIPPITTGLLTALCSRPGWLEPAHPRLFALAQAGPLAMSDGSSPGTA